MPAREPLRPRLPDGANARVAAPVPGRAVLFVMLAVGLSVVGGVATFAALTRAPRPEHSPPAPSSEGTDSPAASTTPP